jgi:hypothetical protein
MNSASAGASTWSRAAFDSSSVRARKGGPRRAPTRRTAVNYKNRYNDVAYWQIHGREQQLIGFFGGARSDTGKPYRTENDVRGVGKDNPLGRQFHDAATAKWGQLHRYTGY